MRKLIIISVLLSGIIYTSCEKLDVPKGIPRCIKKKIREEIKENKCLERVIRGEFEGEIVYQFIRCTDDSTGGFFLDENCEMYCWSTPPLNPNTDMYPCQYVYKNFLNKELIYIK